DNISLNVTAEKGTNDIAYYHYSKDDGKTWEKKTKNTHTFDGLTDTTTYKIRVKLEDSEGNFSTEYYANIDTETYNYPLVTDLTVDENTIKYNGFKVTATATEGTAPIKNYYFSISTDKETWTNESTAQTTNSYTFTDLTASRAYYVKVRVVDNNNKETIFILTTIITTPEMPTPLVTIIKNLYTIDGTNNLYKHDGSGAYTNVAQEAGDNSYRYAGSSETTNNYVCFGSKETVCPEDNLYRIIGVFEDRVKLIKSDYATSDLLGTDGDYDTISDKSSTSKSGLSQSFKYYWSKANKTTTNTWSISLLNTTNLNVNFINNIGTEWANLIDDTTWYVGGMGWSNGIASSNIAKTAYNHEVGQNKTGTTYRSKIGMMYLSDYYYAAAPIHWTKTGSLYNGAVSDNWMYMGEYEWPISRYSDVTGGAFRIESAGNTYVYGVASDSFAVRPTFYLKFDVGYIGGDGTANLPYRLSV
ncbi:MAG: fibronectin type III domain-containing protein, partial [Bacilli bacterium]|nr:fibronectin type III domain-containing protein [Bacilli bacterium]